MVAPYGYTHVTNTTNIVRDIIVPQRSRNLERVDPDREHFATFYDAMVQMSKPKPKGDRIYDCNVAFPAGKFITPLAEVTAGTNVSVSVGARQAAQVFAGLQILDKRYGRELRISNTPAVGDTVIILDQVYETIPAGTPLRITARYVGDGYMPSDGRNHDIGKFTNALSTIQRAYSIDKFLKYSEVYIGGVQGYNMYLNDNFLQDIDEDRDAVLCIGRYRDGTTDGLFKGRGLMQLGEQYNFFTVPSGTLTETFWSAMTARITRMAGRKDRIVAYFPMDLYGKFAGTRSMGGVLNYLDQGSEVKKFGYDTLPYFTNPFALGTIPCEYSRTLDIYSDRIMFVNWSKLKPATFEMPEEMIVPGKFLPNGTAVIGSSELKSQYTGSVGFEPTCPPVAVWIINNVKTFRKNS